MFSSTCSSAYYTHSTSSPVRADYVHYTHSTSICVVYENTAVRRFSFLPALLYTGPGEGSIFVHWCCSFLYVYVLLIE